MKADLKLEDEISYVNSIKMSSKILSFDIILENPTQSKVKHLSIANIFFLFNKYAYSIIVSYI